MTNNNHPITVPPELMQQWRDEWQEKWKNVAPFMQLGNYIAIQAARWGADQELEACCEWFVYTHPDDRNLGALRAARRPQPPTLKEQALALLDKAEDPIWDINDFSIVRRALEQLDD